MNFHAEIKAPYSIEVLFLCEKTCCNPDMFLHHQPPYVSIGIILILQGCYTAWKTFKGPRILFALEKKWEKTKLLRKNF